MNNLPVEIIGILLLTLIGGVGYYIRDINADIKSIEKKVDKMDYRIQDIGLSVADIKPKVDALWKNFLKNKDS